jgi:methyltransferase-like protein
MDLMQVEESMGPMDYIICHGVYSWVPDAVRRKILEICRNLLTPIGIAYISFNTYPGWHLRGIVRDMMAYHAGRYDPPPQRLAQVRRLMQVMEAAVGDRETVYGRIVSDEARDLADQADYYVVHEHLDGVNRPFYFHEFQSQCEEFGLTYLSEAGIASSAWGRHGNKADAALAELAQGPLQREQYLDYLINRIFRRSLICRKDATTELAVRPEALQRMRLAACLRVTSGKPDLHAGHAATFEAIDGKRITTDHPALKRALWSLSQAWPRSVGFPELMAGCRPANTSTESELPGMLLECVVTGLLTINREAPALAGVLSQRPRAFEYARRQAEEGVDVVTSLRHRSVVLDRIDPAVLAKLDGSRTASQVVDDLVAMVARGEIQAGGEGSPEQMREAMAQYVAGALKRFLDGCLLAG